MKNSMGLGLLLALGAATTVLAQPPQDGGRRGRGGPPGERSGRGPGDMVERLMRLDTNEDGQLSSDELKDSRFLPMLERVDANNDDVVTKDELESFASRAGRGRPGEGRPGEGRPGEGRSGGPEGRPAGGMPRPFGNVVPPEFIAQELGLSDVQITALKSLQEEINAKLEEILTPEQLEKVSEAGRRGPPGRGDYRGGPGGPGRAGGFGRGPGGPPEGRGPGSRGGRGPREGRGPDGPPPAEF